MEEEGWEKIKGKLPITHEWDCNYTVKEGKRGRARGGFVIGKKKDWNLRQGGKLIQREEEGMILTDLILGKESLSIVSVYDEQGDKNRRKNE